MKLIWHSNGEEMLKMGNFQDYFFQNVTLFDEDEPILYAAIQGKFLVEFYDRLIELHEGDGERSIYTYRNHSVLITRKGSLLTINSTRYGVTTYPFEEALSSLFEALKRYLIKIKRVNARVALNDEYPQLSSRVRWYERLTVQAPL